MVASHIYLALKNQGHKISLCNTYMSNNTLCFQGTSAVDCVVKDMFKRVVIASGPEYLASDSKQSYTSSSLVDNVT